MLSPFVLAQDLIQQDFGPMELDAVRTALPPPGNGRSSLDECVDALRALAFVQKRPVEDVLRWAGEAMVAPVVRDVPALVKGHQSGTTWFPLLDGAIRTALTACGCDEAPPEFWVDFLDHSTVRIGFDGPEEIAACVEGAVRGVARHFHERVDISRPTPAAILTERRLIDVKLSPDRRSAQTVSRRN